MMVSVIVQHVFFFLDLVSSPSHGFACPCLFVHTLSDHALSFFSLYESMLGGQVPLFS
jgi:hypothetical protein